MADWEIKKALGQCSGTGRNIEFGEEYYAALVETEEGFDRRDYSLEYWQAEQPQVYYFWKTRLPNPDDKKKIFIDDNMLMAFFERLEEETSPEKVNFRFVLMLILMRKRLLRYESSELEDGKEIWKLKVTGSKNIVDVINPHLTEDQIESLSGQVGQIMQLED